MEAPVGTQGSGIARPRTRRSEQATRALMLRTAVAAIAETGLTVSLEHISMEDVLREAGVSRTAVYRLWPAKSQFIGDLILELATMAIPTVNTRSDEASELLRRLVLHRMEDLRTPRARWQLVSEIIAKSSAVDLEHTPSLLTQWRTYFALVAMIANLPDGELRAQALRAISSSERQYRDRLSSNFSILASIFGFRLAEPTTLPATAVADLVIALLRGLVLREHTRDPADGEGDGGLDPLPAAGLTAILTRCFETDPAITWDDARLEHLRDLLSNSPNLFEPPA